MHKNSKQFKGKYQELLGFECNQSSGNQSPPLNKRL